MIGRLQAESQAVIDAREDKIEEARIRDASGRLASPADEPAGGETHGCQPDAPVEGAGIETPCEVVESEISDEESFTAEDLAEAAEDIDLENDPPPAGFVVAFTTSRVRRLHFVGNCGRRPGEHYRSFEVYGDDAPEPTKYDKRCRQCFPEDGKTVTLMLESLKEDSDSSGSSTHSSQLLVFSTDSRPCFRPHLPFSRANFEA